MKSVKVFAPATVANVGCGFDAMGFAFEGVGDEIEMWYNDTDSISYINDSGVVLPEDPEKNLMTPALRAIMDSIGERRGVVVRLTKKISPGSGIGSSAASAAAVVFAYNELSKSNFSKDELITFALEGECMASGAKHADNVAPAMMGGIILVRDYDPIDIVRLQPSKNIYCAVVHPHIEVKTIDSRAVLKPTLPLATAVRQWANLGSMVASILTGDFKLMSRSLKDLVAEPYRKKFIPQYDSLKSKIMSAGAIGSNISGSGPSVFALCEDAESAKKISTIMSTHFKELAIECDSYSSIISNEGTRLIK